MGKEAKTNAMRILDRAGISYTSMTYSCDSFLDGETVARTLGLDPDRCFKTLVAVGKSGNHFVFVLPVSQELDLKKAARSVGEKSVSLIPVNMLEPLTGYLRGGCTAIGMKKRFPTRLALQAQKYSSIAVSGGRRGLQLELAPDDLLRACDGAYADLLQDNVT